MRMAGYPGSRSLRLDGDQIMAAMFTTDGCAPSVACGSMLTLLLPGKSIQKARDIRPQDLLAELGGLPEDSVHCATLAVNTLNLALDR